MPRYELVTGNGLARDPDLAQLLAASGRMSIAGADYGRLAIMGEDAGGQITPAMIQQVMAMRLAQSSLMTKVDSPEKAREYPLGFLSAAAVAAGAVAQVISRPQVVFRPERLFIPSDIAGQFQVNQIVVGKNPMQASFDPLPGRIFDERSVGVRLMMDTAQISQDCVLNVTNIGGAPAFFRAALVGPAVE
jgi:hypothetical protein